MVDPTTTILVVDDNDQLRNIAVRVLRRKGYVVIEARDGNEGLRAARDTAIDVVVADVCMPDLDGRAMVAAMRDRQPDVEIVMMSGLDSVRAGVAELGRARFLQKPFTPSSLCEAVAAVLPTRPKTLAG